MYLNRRHGGVYVYLCDANKLVGTAALYPRVLGRTPYVELANFFIMENFRGRGIGSAVVEELLKFVKDRGYKGLMGYILYSDSLKNIVRRLKFYFNLKAHIKIIMREYGRTFKGTKVPVFRFFIY